MKKTRHTPNQIITKLRKVEAARAEGRTVADAVRDIDLVDSFPAEACDNIRFAQRRLYRAEGGPDEDFRYITSKKQYFFGVKIHLLVAAEGFELKAFLFVLVLSLDGLS